MLDQQNHEDKSSVFTFFSFSVFLLFVDLSFLCIISFFFEEFKKIILVIQIYWPHPPSIDFVFYFEENFKIKVKVFSSEEV